MRRTSAQVVFIVAKVSRARAPLVIGPLPAGAAPAGRADVLARGVGRELHVAINTIPKPRDRARLLESIPRLLDLGIRDVIVNDIGILRTLRHKFSELRLTASVGCGALNAADVAFFRDLGAHAVV